MIVAVNFVFIACRGVRKIHCTHICSTPFFVDQVPNVDSSIFFTTSFTFQVFCITHKAQSNVLNFTCQLAINQIHTIAQNKGKEINKKIFDMNLPKNTTMWSILGDPEEGQRPTQKYGMALVIPLVVGIIVLAAMITAAIFYCSYKQEQLPPKHSRCKCCFHLSTSGANQCYLRSYSQ